MTFKYSCIVPIFFLWATMGMGQSSHSSNYKGVANILHEDSFWKIIERTFITNDDDSNGNNLKAELSKLEDSMIIGFYLKIKQLQIKSYIGSLWCAAHIIDGGCGDSEFEYFRAWLISKGKNTFYSALSNPDTLYMQPAYRPDGFVSWSLWQVPLEIIYSRMPEISSIHDHINYEAFEKLYGKETSDIDLTWSDNKELMKKLCPRLYAKYWDN